MVITAEEITSSWGTFRVVHEENEWFMVGNDMAAILQYSDLPRSVKRRVSEENRHHTTIETSGGAQTITVINEVGFYELVFGSKMPMAEEFQKWVTNEVLPELRKNGHYGITSDEVILSKEEYQEMKFKADSYAIINNQYQNLVSALQAEHIHWVNAYKRFVCDDYKRFVCDVVKMMNIRKINSMKNNEIALRFDDIPWEYMQYAIATNDPNQPFIVDFDKLNANIY